MRDKTYDGWIEVREEWRACGSSPISGWGGKLEHLVYLYANWWKNNPNPYGWNTSIEATRAKGWKHE